MKKLEKKIVQVYGEGIKSIKKKGSIFGYYNSEDHKICFSVYQVSPGFYELSTVIIEEQKPQ